MNWILTFFLMLVTGNLNGCASRNPNFSRVRVGMDKSDVLEVVGNPQRIARIKGHDRWIYFDNLAGAPIERSVVFASGRVIGMVRSDQEKQLEDELEKRK